jgi:PP-loop superfamily ATP-utilizing enzyme
MDSLDDLVSDGVVYSDVLAHDSDTFGRPGLRQAVQEFQAGHPLAHFTVVSHCPYLGCEHQHPWQCMHA